MALQKVVGSVRHQLYRMLFVPSRLCSNEPDFYVKSFKPQQEVEQSEIDNEPKPRGQDGINEVFLCGTIFGVVLPTVNNNGVTFLLDTPQNGRYGQYRVRTKVVALSGSLPAEGTLVLKEGQKLFVRGRLGSKVEKNADGSNSFSTYVLARLTALM